MISNCDHWIGSGGLWITMNLWSLIYFLQISLFSFFFCWMRYVTCSQLHLQWIYIRLVSDSPPSQNPIENYVLIHVNNKYAGWPVYIFAVLDFVFVCCCVKKKKNETVNNGLLIVFGNDKKKYETTRTPNVLFLTTVQNQHMVDFHFLLLIKLLANCWTKVWNLFNRIESVKHSVDMWLVLFGHAKIRKYDDSHSNNIYIYKW